MRHDDRKERDRRLLELRDLRAVLAMVEGRRFLMRLLEETKVFRDIYDQSARIHYNAGQQSIGHWAIDDIEAADDEALPRMMLEKRAQKKADQREDEAFAQDRDAEKSEDS